MNLQFKKHAKGFRIIRLNGKAIGTLEYTRGKWLALSGINPEYRRYYKSIADARLFCKADPRFYLGIGA